MAKKNNDEKENLDEVVEETTQQEDSQTEQDAADQEMEQLKQQVQELKDQNLRQYAEFDNFRKRTQREKLESYKNATADCVLQFITVLDNLERALDAEKEDSSMKKGVEMIATQFKEVMAKMDVHEINALNQPFDPELHNAVNQVQDENYGENTICQVFQKGYQMGDKVIRHAMVVVANP
ncbi:MULTISPECIES: nucleotide exchange factor GrpE [Clostridiaceae]|uniref:Protein GrpE n=1 Tax=Clostridium facile TaxID=2763035 RepID=A0ABR7ITB0_9CLOT|nr:MULTISPECIES: nucleotide exchange factor GrpE [Clostridiaceae]MBC5788365.1 nucleotide exchange factor GrpE [Clostridium facile]PWM98273.1 MAG: nucleotide exchange factor GrpE [Massilioclostridium sp.]